MMAQLTDGERLELALFVMDQHSREQYYQLEAYCEEQEKPLDELSASELRELLEQTLKLLRTERLKRQLL